LRHGCLCAFILCLCCPVWVGALRLADRPSYRLCIKIKKLKKRPKSNKRGPLSFVRIIEELLEWKSSGSGQENWINGRGDPLRWPCDTHSPQKLARTSPTSGGGSVSIVRLRTKSHGVLWKYFTSWTTKSPKAEVLLRFKTRKSLRT
jgi:hypothetical protein